VLTLSREVDECKPLLDGIRKCVTAGFFYHTAKLQKNGSYRTAGAYTRPLFSST